jgi:ribosomal 50S subunit-recycling heat shock protein
MRIDKFLKVLMLIKRRTVANEMADEGFVKLNGRPAKPGSKVKVGDVIEIDMWNYNKQLEILKVPEKGSVPKKDVEDYIKIISYTTKDQ